MRGTHVLNCPRLRADIYIILDRFMVIHRKSNIKWCHETKKTKTTHIPRIVHWLPGFTLRRSAKFAPRTILGTPGSLVWSCLVNTPRYCTNEEPNDATFNINIGRVLEPNSLRQKELDLTISVTWFIFALKLGIAVFVYLPIVRILFQMWGWLYAH